MVNVNPFDSLYPQYIERVPVRRVLTTSVLSLGTESRGRGGDERRRPDVYTYKV